MDQELPDTAASMLRRCLVCSHQMAALISSGSNVKWRSFRLFWRGRPPTR